jgi:predicted ArsR family transcriptional regulator
MSERADDLSAIALLDEPTRRRLYDWVVAQRRPVGREEAARAVGVTRALATFHLDRLADGGLLTAGYRRLTGRVGPGAGRPARVYERAARDLSVTIPDRRYERAAELFAGALEAIGSGDPPRSLVDAARAMGTELGSAPSRRRGAQGRLLGALERGGYEPVVEPGGTIRLRNCPYHALAEAHRGVVCGTNLALAQGMVDAAGADVSPRLDPQPGFCCVAFTPGR